MTLEGWRELLRKAQDDPELFDLTARVLYEQDEARARLARMGLRWTGLD
jgi:hypothetical protein